MSAVQHHTESRSFTVPGEIIRDYCELDGDWHLRFAKYDAFSHPRNPCVEVRFDKFEEKAVDAS